MNFDPVGEQHVGFLSKKRPRIFRSGDGCGGQSSDVAFIYSFST